jgi:hypothetical protein
LEMERDSRVCGVQSGSRFFSVLVDAQCCGVYVANLDPV